MAYADIYQRSLTDPDGFWGEVAESLVWDVRWDRVLDDSRPPFYRWFAGGRLNTCYNTLDRHVDGGRADQIAIAYDSPVTSTVERITYQRLRDEVARFAGALAGLGVGRGDRVIIYMPMVPEAVVGMLACARLGAVHSVVFGGFASRELAVRIDDAAPRGHPHRVVWHRGRPGGPLPALTGGCVGDGVAPSGGGGGPATSPAPLPASVRPGP